MTPLYLRVLHDSVEQAAAHAGIFNLLADVAGDRGQHVMLA